MKLRLFARNLSPYLTAYLLAVSLGLPLHRVYCACRGSSEWQLLLADHECGHATDDFDFTGAVILGAAIPASAAPSGSDCCGDFAPSCDLTTIDGHDCGSREVTLAKLANAFLLSETKWTDLTHAPTLPTVAVEFPVPVIVPRRPRSLPVRGPDPAVPPYGRALLVAYQLFLC